MRSTCCGHLLQLSGDVGVALAHCWGAAERAQRNRAQASSFSCVCGTV
jgi:hypothetical protein